MIKDNVLGHTCHHAGVKVKGWEVLNMGENDGLNPLVVDFVLYI